MVENQDTVTSNTAAGDNCYVIHAHKFLIPYQKMDIFDVNSIVTDQDAVIQKPSNPHQQDPVMHKKNNVEFENMNQDTVKLKFPETNVVENIVDDTLDMANKFDVNSMSTEQQDAVPHSPAPSTSAKAATEVSL